MYQNIPDHPVIRNCEQTGYPGPITAPSTCPICKAETETIYLDSTGQPIGCDICTSKHMADSQEIDICPECGASQPEWIYAKHENVIGCDQCIEEQDACEYRQNLS